MRSEFFIIFFGYIFFYTSCSAMSIVQPRDQFYYSPTQAQMCAWRLVVKYMQNSYAELKVLPKNAPQVHPVIPNEFLPYGPDTIEF